MNKAKIAIQICICYIAVVICVFFFFGKFGKNIFENNAPVTLPENDTLEEPDIPETFENISVDIDDFGTEMIIEEPKKLLRRIDEDDPEPITTKRYYKPKRTREILISAVGDLTLASNYRKPYSGSFYQYYDLYGPGYFCENVLPVFRDSDCVIANLECALTDNNDLGIRAARDYNYKGYTEYTGILTASNIDVVNRANNHSYDYSQTGYNDTTAALDDAGIGHFGNGAVLIKEINGITVGFIGVLGYRTGEVKKELDYLKENGAEIKIVTFHWGNMDERVANYSQVSAAHYAIDNGADLVIGHHPHVLQGIEIYKGKYIAYSLGNFIFDGNVISDIENRTSVIFQQKFVLYGTDIIENSINLIPILTTSGMSTNNFKPMIAEGKQKEDILNKIEARSAYHRKADEVDEELP